MKANEIQIMRTASSQLWLPGGSGEWRCWVSFIMVRLPTLIFILLGMECPSRAAVWAHFCSYYFHNSLFIMLEKWGSLPNKNTLRIITRVQPGNRIVHPAKTNFNNRMADCSRLKPRWESSTIARSRPSISKVQMLEPGIEYSECRPRLPESPTANSASALRVFGHDGSIWRCQHLND